MSKKLGRDLKDGDKLSLIDVPLEVQLYGCGAEKRLGIVVVGTYTAEFLEWVNPEIWYEIRE